MYYKNQFTSERAKKAYIDLLLKNWLRKPVRAVYRMKFLTKK